MKQHSWGFFLAVQTRNVHHVDFQVSACWVKKRLGARPAGRGAISQRGSLWYHLRLDLDCLGLTAPLLGTPQPAGQQTF